MNTLFTTTPMFGFAVMVLLLKHGKLPVGYFFGRDFIDFFTEKTFHHILPCFGHKYFPSAFTHPHVKELYWFKTDLFPSFFSFFVATLTFGSGFTDMLSPTGVNTKQSSPLWVMMTSSPFRYFDVFLTNSNLETRMVIPMFTPSFSLSRKNPSKHSN